MWKKVFVGILIPLFGFIMYVSNLSEAVSGNKPIDIYNSIFNTKPLIENSSQIKNSLKYKSEEIKIGILDIRNIDENNENSYNKIYAKQINQISNTDSLNCFAVPIILKNNKIEISDSLVKSILKEFNIDIIVWGLYQKNFNSTDLYAINYKSKKKNKNSYYNEMKLRQEFVEGQFLDLINGKMSGDLHKIIYSLSLMSEIKSGNFEKAKNIIKKNAIRNGEDSFFYFWTGYLHIQSSAYSDALKSYHLAIENIKDSCDNITTFSYSNLGLVYNQTGDYKNKIIANKLALKNYLKCNEKKDSLFISHFLNNIGQSYIGINNDSSKYYLNQAYNVTIRKKYHKLLPLYYMNLSVLKMNEKDYLSAVYASLEAIKIIKTHKLQNQEILDEIYCNLGISQIKIENYIEGMLALKASLDINENDGILYSPTSITALTELGFLLLQRARHDSLIQDIKSKLDIINNNHILKGMNKVHFNEYCGEYYRYIGNYELSIYHYQEVLNTIYRMDNENKDFYKITCSNLATIYKEKGDVMNSEKYFKLSMLDKTMLFN